jgi:hypothetical protein
MIDGLQEITLGPEAVDYFGRFVSGCDGRRHLSKFLSENFKFESGTIRTYLPPGVPLETIHQFEFGGKLPQPIERIKVAGGYAVPIPNLDVALVARIQAHLTAYDSAFCIFQNGVLRPNDPALRRLPPTHTLICEDTVCHYLNSSDKDLPDLIGKTIKVARSGGPPYLVGCAGKSAPVSSFQGEAIKSETLEEFAQRVDVIFLGAYDGEGFLIWTR